MRVAPLLALLAGLGLLLMTKKTWTIPPAGMAYFSWFNRAEDQYGLPAQLLARVAWQESRFDPSAFNASSGARGMMQIVPRWHPEVDPADLNPLDDIAYAARYLRENFDRFGSWAKALAAYNWGPGNLADAIDEYGARWLAAAPAETQNYVREITADVGLSVA